MWNVAKGTWCVKCEYEGLHQESVISRPQSEPGPHPGRTRTHNQLIAVLIDNEFQWNISSSISQCSLSLLYTRVNCLWWPDSLTGERPQRWDSNLINEIRENQWQALNRENETIRTEPSLETGVVCLFLLQPVQDQCVLLVTAGN